MTLICLASQKGSPGTTATALAVAAALKVSDGRRKLLVEADSAGGTLAIRYRMPVEPGLLTLAAAVRAGIEPEGLWGHAHELPGGLSVVVCPDDSDQVHAAMAASGALLGRFLDGIPDVDVICDVGRLGPDSPSMAFVTQASALLMVARPTAEQLQPAARRLVSLKAQINNLGWVLVGRKPYGAAEVEATYDFPVVGLIADDPRSVASLERGGMSKRLRRHPFVRSSTTLADTLADWLAPIGGAAPEPTPAAATAMAAPAPSQSRNSSSGLAVPASPPMEMAAPAPALDTTPAAPFTATPPEPAAPPESLHWAAPEWSPPAAEQRSQSGEVEASEDTVVDDVAVADEIAVVEEVAVAEDNTVAEDLESTESFEEAEDDWDGSEFTTTADLHLVFDRPHADVAAEIESIEPVEPVESIEPVELEDLPIDQERPTPPMPPPAARTKPPFPVLEGAVSMPLGSADSQTLDSRFSNGQGLNGHGHNGGNSNGQNQTGRNSNGTGLTGETVPPLPGPERLIQPEQPAPFPQDEDDGDESER